MKKRGFLLALVLVLVLGLMPLPAQAETAMALNSHQTLTLQPDEVQYFTFTAAADGKIVAYTPRGEHYYDEEAGYYRQLIFDLRIYDSDGAYVSWFEYNQDYEAVLITAKAGETYKLEVRSDLPQTYTGEVYLEEMKPASSVEIEDYSPTEYVGDDVYCYAQINPNNCFEECTWTVSDETVINSDYYNDAYFSGTALKTGTVTLTVTTESGKTDSVTITVKEKETISLGESKMLTLQPDERACYSFTPDRDCAVVVYAPNGEVYYDEEYDSYYMPSFYLQIRDEEYNYGDHVGNDDYSGTIMNVKAGKTYTIRVENNNRVAMTGAVKLEVTKPAESIEIQDDTYTGFVGEDVYLYAEQNPNTSFETCTWTVSDETVIKNESGNGSNFWGTALKPGTATVTVTTASGKSDSVKVTIKEKGVIRVGESKTLTLQPDDSQAYTYTAEKTGEVVVYMPLGEVVEVNGVPSYYNTFDMYMYGNMGRESDYVTTPVYDGIKLNAVAGKTYTLMVYNSWDYPVTATFTMAENKALTSFVLNQSAVTVAVGKRNTYLEVIPTPETAFGDFTWTSSNPAVCDILDTGASTYAYLDPLAAGTATITAKSSDGKTASCVVTVTGSPFADVTDPNAYYYKAVLWAVGSDITNGVDATHFAPDDSCTRAQIVTFLWRAAGCPEPTTAANPFQDVDPSAWYGKAVLWAAEEGITTGLSATTFGTNDICTRSQVATFLWRFFGKPAPGSHNPFADVVSGEFYYDAVLWAVENGITNGTSATTFEPNAYCTRGQIVTFLYRAIG